MNNLKRVVGLIPEFYFLLIILFITFVNPDWKSIVVTFIFAIQLLVRNKILGYIVLSIIVFYTLWILGAIISDLCDYGAFDSRAVKFTILSGWIVVVNFVMGVLLFKKYSKYPVFPS